ncbi:hypothetical protein F-liban_294 [Faustovirus]|nr:hypothetical protein F-liban_294 [Faustovirus]
MGNTATCNKHKSSIEKPVETELIWFWGGWAIIEKKPHGARKNNCVVA